jgi:hypothetical protein
MRRLVSLLAAGVLLLGIAGPAAAGGPPSLAFYVDGVRFRTIGTPTDLSGTGAPAHSFDTIYLLGDGLVPVSDAGPRSGDYNGGRWMVLPVTWHVAPVQLVSDEQIDAYAAAGMLTVGSEPVMQFVCPAIPVGGRG